MKKVTFLTAIKTNVICSKYSFHANSAVKMNGQ
jgi:hypothetical protein